MERAFRVGVSFPTTEIGADAVVIRDFAQAVEDLGFSHLKGLDHVVGANTASRPGWSRPYNHLSAFYEPLVLFSYLAGITTRLGFVTGVVIMPQRQTVLFAKQAANLDIFCGGRLRLGLGLGWNQVEYEALGVPFARRGVRMDDQIRVLRRLWTEPTLTEDGPFHRITDAGINPLPLQRPIPIWIGGWSEPAVARAVRLGDGWMPSLPAERAQEAAGGFHEALRKAGRDPASVGLENTVLLGATVGGPIRDVEAGVADAEAWRKAGATGVNFHTMDMGLSSPDAHVALLRRISEMLELTKGPAASA